jgi:hypothetical protein
MGSDVVDIRLATEPLIDSSLTTKCCLPRDAQKLQQKPQQGIRD